MAQMFRTPLRVTVGLGYIREVTDPADALAFLNEWPAHRRGPLHNLALKLSAAALVSECEITTARRAFAAFAEANGVLTFGDDNNDPSRATSRSQTAAV